ncbi:hypothetical protein [Clostridium intestinale]|jgi:hypothetical protein|uniref:DUF3784 domain-containing protein n=2 Tax=Clostridium intestinale TaxID=36845 RepID=U2N4R4_9CLOT|nr:hypothetical protein [Clostridium intestinale]ERK30492.1 hypothetical protein CINTURNW_2498 [Clostridium intestinale URNW]QLY81578.1 hypothetical protein HZF06_08360 [Clostridium intestinale]
MRITWSLVYIFVGMLFILGSLSTYKKDKRGKIYKYGSFGLGKIGKYKLLLSIAEGIVLIILGLISLIKYLDFQVGVLVICIVILIDNILVPKLEKKISEK